MQIPTRTRFIGDEDALAIWWTIGGDLIDFTTGYTFEARLGPVADISETVFVKTTGFIGAAGSGTEKNGIPNLEIHWAPTGELNSVTAGSYIFQVVATATDGAESTLQIQLDMRARVGDTLMSGGSTNEPDEDPIFDEDALIWMGVLQVFS